MTTNILIVFGCISGAILFLYAVVRTLPTHSRKESNDFTSAVVAVIGTTYAVLLAFMLANVWNMFQQAQINAEQEANDLVNVYRLASLLQDPARGQIQELARNYASDVVNIEFPSMSRDEMPQRQVGPVGKIWVAASQIRPHTNEESQVMAELMSTLRSLTEHRRIRIMQSHESLPAILWAVLITGGVITVAAACFFGVQNFRFHLLQIIVLSFLIALVLIAIADIDRPYQGMVKVTPVGFEFALRTFNTDEL